MDIKLIPAGGTGTRFTFPALPEQIKVKSGAKYQSYDIISQGTVKVPKGTDATEVSWDGEFFGRQKENERLVRPGAWTEPSECVKILNDYMLNETVLNLIVTETWINLDVTLSQFQVTEYGAYGNIKYSLVFVQRKPLEIYTTNELNIATFVRKTRPRSEEPVSEGETYTVASGDTLWAIAQQFYNDGGRWTEIYDANADLIEATAAEHGMSGSDHGHWIWPGETFVIP